MTAKEQAILDIKDALGNKPFIPFRTELDSTMDQLVKQQIQKQYDQYSISCR